MYFHQIEGVEFIYMKLRTNFSFHPVRTVSKSEEEKRERERERERETSRHTTSAKSAEQVHKSFVRFGKYLPGGVSPSISPPARLPRSQPRVERLD